MIEEAALRDATEGPPDATPGGSDWDIVFECRNVYHWFGSNKVLHDVDLKVVRGEIAALVGPSGCGKSTLLRAILGTHPPRAGEILMNGRAVSGPGRDRGIVYQRYSLFPFLTAQQNVAFGLMVDETKLHDRFLFFWRWRNLRREHLEKAAHLLEKVGLGSALKLYPTEMSGGMRQRVALAQALIMQPEILLLDEPFGALDEATREDLQGMLLELYQENLAARERGEKPPHTIIIVTHELNEAIYVSDRIFALSQYWDWKADGHAEPPGASIIYDAVAPVYGPEETRDFQQFVQQREEVRAIAFAPLVPARRNAHRRFWDEVAAGKGMGILER